MLSVFLMLCCCQTVAAEESSWSWLWPFGQEEPAEQPYPTTDPSAHSAARRTADRATLRRSPRHRIGVPGNDFPKPRMPQLWPGKPEADEARNAWTEKKAEPESASPWQVVTESTQRLGDSTRKAWHKTVDVLTPEYLKADNRPASRVAQRDPLWKRAFGSGEKEPEGPQTVTEWMAQERLNP
jgi:hypothetical protein